MVTMRPEAMDTLKSTLGDTYKYYYTNSTNDWIREIVNENPFEEAGVCPDIQLTPLDMGLSPGEIDVRNCIAVHSALRNVDEATASDEALWAGLCNGPYYSYVRQRWEYAPSRLKGTPYECSTVESRFFMPDHRHGLFRNTLAKCWWVGHLLYDRDSSDPYHKLWTIGENSFSTKVSDIFVNNNFSFSPTVLDGIVGMFAYFNQMGAPVSVPMELRFALQRLNLLGGVVLLDALSSEEITEKLKEWVLRQRGRGR